MGPPAAACGGATRTGCYAAPAFAGRFRGRCAPAASAPPVSIRKEYIWGIRHILGRCAPVGPPAAACGGATSPGPPTPLPAAARGGAAPPQARKALRRGRRPCPRTRPPASGPADGPTATGPAPRGRSASGEARSAECVRVLEEADAGQGRSRLAGVGCAAAEGGPPKAEGARSRLRPVATGRHRARGAQPPPPKAVRRRRKAALGRQQRRSRPVAGGRPPAVGLAAGAQRPDPVRAEPVREERGRRRRRRNARGPATAEEVTIVATEEVEAKPTIVGKQRLRRSRAPAHEGAAAGPLAGGPLLRAGAAGPRVGGGGRALGQGAGRRPQAISFHAALLGRRYTSPPGPRWRWWCPRGPGPYGPSRRRRR